MLVWRSQIPIWLMTAVESCSPPLIAIRILDDECRYVYSLNEGQCSHHTAKIVADESRSARSHIACVRYRRRSPDGGKRVVRWKTLTSVEAEVFVGIDSIVE